MKLQTSRINLLKALEQAIPATDKHGQLPILSHALLTAKDGALTISATDLALSRVTRIDATFDSDASAAIPAKALADRLRALSGDTVSLDVKDDVLSVKCSGSRVFRVSCLPGNEFPTIAVPDAIQWLTVETETLITALDSVKHAVATDESRCGLCNALLEIGADITCVCTDGHRLACAVLTNHEEAGAGISALVQRRGVAMLTDIPAKTVLLGLAKGVLYARFDTTTIGIRTSNEQFPPWQAVIPKKSHWSMSINRRALIDALKASALSAGKSAVTLTASKDILRLEVKGGEFGELDDELQCETTGKSIAQAFEVGYLIQALTATPGETCVFECGNDETDPVVIRDSAVSAGGMIRNLVMPRRI